MQPSKCFTPLPPVNLNYEQGRILYYPPGWSKTTEARTSQSGAHENVCVTNRIRASGIPEEMTKADLHLEFSRYGPIRTIRMVRNKYRHRKGFALITYCTANNVELALKASPEIRIQGHRISLHKAVEQPRFTRNDLEPLCRAYSNETMLAICEKYKKVFLSEDIDSAPKPTYDWLQAIDSRMPLNLKRSTKCDSICSTEGSSRSSIIEEDRISCDEDTNNSLKWEVQVKSERSESKIKPLEESHEDLAEIENVVYPTSSDNQLFYHNPDYRNKKKKKRKNPPENFVTYRDVNPMIYQPIQQRNNFQMYAPNYCYSRNEYLAPQPNMNYNPCYVYSGMFQYALNNQFFTLNSPVYATAYNNEGQANDMYYNQIDNAAQEANSPYFDNDTNETNNESIDGLQISDLPDELQSYKNYTCVDDDDSSSDSDRSAERYLLSSVQEYADSFVENLKLLEAFQEQFFDAPFTFLQPEEFEPKDNSPVLQSRLSFDESESDDSITVEIDYSIDYNRYLKRARRSSYDYDSTPTKLNLLKPQETEFDQSTSLNDEIEPEKILDEIEPENILDEIEPEKILDEIEPEKILDEIEPEKILDEIEPEEILDEIEPEKILDEITDNENAVPEICNTTKDYYLVQVRDVATQFPEYDENTFTQQMNELSLLDNEIQPCSTPINEQGETKALCLTYANATKSRKQNN